MTIYADILILINIYIDYFLILAVRRFFHLWTKPWRMVLGAVFGGFCGLLGLVPMAFPLSLFVLFICGGIICLIAFYDGNKIMYIKVACFFTFSMIFSGFYLVLVELLALMPLLYTALYTLTFLPLSLLFSLSFLILYQTF